MHKNHWRDELRLVRVREASICLSIGRPEGSLWTDYALSTGQSGRSPTLHKQSCRTHPRIILAALLAPAPDVQ
jgi:hypothetical protein